MTKKREELPDWRRRMLAETTEVDSLTHALAQAMAERDRALMQRDSWQMRAAAAEQERDEARAELASLKEKQWPSLQLVGSVDADALDV